MSWARKWVLKYTLKAWISRAREAVTEMRSKTLSKPIKAIWSFCLIGEQNVIFDTLNAQQCNLLSHTLRKTNSSLFCLAHGMLIKTCKLGNDPFRRGTFFPDVKRKVLLLSIFFFHLVSRGHFQSGWMYSSLSLEGPWTAVNTEISSTDCKKALKRERLGPCVTHWK